MTRPTITIPGVRCPKCGSAEGDGEDGRPLRCIGSRRIGRTRQQDWSCGACGRSFRVNVALDWTPGTDSAIATIENT